MNLLDRFLRPNLRVGGIILGCFSLYYAILGISMYIIRPEIAVRYWIATQTPPESTLFSSCMYIILFYICTLFLLLLLFIKIFLQKNANQYFSFTKFFLCFSHLIKSNPVLSLIVYGCFLFGIFNVSKNCIFKM